VKNFKSLSILLIVSIALLSIAYFFEFKNDKIVNQVIDVDGFRKTLSEKQEKLQALVAENENLFKNKEFSKLFEFKSLKLGKELENEQFILLAFENDSLRFWSNNFISYSEIKNIYKSKNDFVKTGNSWLIKQSYKFNEVDVLGLIIVKTEYSYENEFLANAVNSSFKLPAYTDFSNVPETEGYIITNNNGEFLLSIIPEFRLKNSSINLLLSVLFYVAFLISFVIFIRNLSKVFRRKSIHIFLFLLLMLLLRFLLFYFKIPAIFYNLEIFDPKLFATSVFLPNLGDFLINEIFIFYLIIVLYKELADIVQIIKFKLIRYKNISFFVLVFDSSISLELNNILSINFSSIVAYVVISLLFLILAFSTKWIVEIISNNSNKKSFYVSLIISVFIFFLASIISHYVIGLLSVVLAVAVLILFRIIFDKYENKWYSYVFYFITIFVLYTVIIITVSSENKEKSVRKLLVTNLANERDPIAELQMADFEKNILDDKKII